VLYVVCFFNSVFEGVSGVSAECSALASQCVEAG